MWSILLVVALRFAKSVKGYQEGLCDLLTGILSGERDGLVYPRLSEVTQGEGSHEARIYAISEYVEP